MQEVQPHNLTREDLAAYFDMPIKVAAKEIGICTTILKKLCRKNGIPRWPHRKIQSLNKAISALETVAGKDPKEDKRIRQEIALLVRQKEYIKSNPSTISGASKKRKRTNEDVDTSEDTVSPPSSPSAHQTTPRTKSSPTQDISIGYPGDMPKFGLTYQTDHSGIRSQPSNSFGVYTSCISTYPSSGAEKVDNDVVQYPPTKKQRTIGNLSSLLVPTNSSSASYPISSEPITIPDQKSSSQMTYYRKQSYSEVSTRQYPSSVQDIPSGIQSNGRITHSFSASQSPVNPSQLNNIPSTLLPPTHWAPGVDLPTTSIRSLSQPSPQQEFHIPLPDWFWAERKAYLAAHPLSELTS